MINQDNLKLEGRIGALREMILLLVQNEIERNPETTILNNLEALIDAPDHQEDPGAVNVEAIAIQNAAHREIETIIEAVRARQAASTVS